MTTGGGAVAIQTHDLVAGFRIHGTAHSILQGLHLRAHAGEFIALAGPNGAGKSTLLRTLAGIQPPVAGTVTIAGDAIGKLSRIELARRLGLVLTERVTIGSMPVYRVVELGRYPHLGWSGTLSSRDRDVTTRAMRAAGIEHLANRDNNRLSDGERQRMMIARALAQEPSILLLDEPTAFLDVPSRVELMGLLRRLAREQDLTVVLSTHDLELALRLVDTVWLIATGGAVTVGTPEDIIFSGDLAAAFASKEVRFDPCERLFRVATSGSRAALVQGEGLAAALARSVLEREGFEILNTGVPDITVAVGSSPLWDATAGRQRKSGESFKDLARFARESGGDNKWKANNPTAR